MRLHRPLPHHAMPVKRRERGVIKVLNFEHDACDRRKKMVLENGTGMVVWHGMVDVCDGCLAAEASGSSFGQGQCHCGMVWHGRGL